MVGEERAHIETIFQYASKMLIGVEKTTSPETLVGSFLRRVQEHIRMILSAQRLIG
jgi:hypothetical protein